MKHALIAIIFLTTTFSGIAFAAQASGRGSGWTESEGCQKAYADASDNADGQVTGRGTCSCNTEKANNGRMVYRCVAFVYYS